MKRVRAGVDQLLSYTRITASQLRPNGRAERSREGKQKGAWKLNFVAGKSASSGIIVLQPFLDVEHDRRAHLCVFGGSARIPTEDKNILPGGGRCPQERYARQVSRCAPPRADD